MRLCCGKFSLTTWHVLSEEGKECLCVCVMVTLKINTHVCLGHLFCQTATRQRRFTFTHRHRADEMSECKRERKKICLLCAVCFFLRVCVLSLFLSLSPTALANNEMYLNSPTQSIGLFVLHVCYSLSLFLSCSLSFNDSRKLPPNCCCGWVFFSFSLNRLQAHTKYKKKEQKKHRKTNTTENYFYFGLWHSHTMILCCYPICGSEMQDAEQQQGQGGVLVFSFSLSQSHSHLLSLACSLDRGTSVLSQVK